MAGSAWAFLRLHHAVALMRTRHALRIERSMYQKPQAKTVFVLNVLDDEAYIEEGLADNFFGPPLFDKLVKTWLPALAPAEFQK